MKKVTMMTVDLDKLISLKGAAKIGICIGAGKLAFDTFDAVTTLALKAILKKLEAIATSLEQEKWKTAAESKMNEKEAE